MDIKVRRDGLKRDIGREGFGGKERDKRREKNKGRKGYKEEVGDLYLTLKT